MDAQAGGVHERVRVGRECCAALLHGAPSGDPAAVLGSVDALKLRSPMTLFQHADPTDRVVGAVLERFYGGVADTATGRLLRQP